MADEQAAPAKTLDIVCNFIGDFEVADNMVRNGQALCALKAANEDGALNKLMVIQAGSIVEVALAQIIYRAQNFNREGVPNITEEERLEIADKKVDKLNNIIQLMKKYKILEMSFISFANAATRSISKTMLTLRACRGAKIARSRTRR